MDTGVVVAPEHARDWPGRLHEAGLRGTIPRLMVLRELERTHHATVQQLRDRLAAKGEPSPDLSTVYRNLETRAAHGLVAHVQLAGAKPSYLLAERAARGHLVCRKCGSINELPPSER